MGHGGTEGEAEPLHLMPGANGVDDDKLDIPVSRDDRSRRLGNPRAAPVPIKRFAVLLEGPAFVGRVLPRVLGMGDDKFPGADPPTAVPIGESLREGALTRADRTADSDNAETITHAAPHYALGYTRSRRSLCGRGADL